MEIVGASRRPPCSLTLRDHPVSRFATATPPKEGNGPPEIPLLWRGGGGAAGVVFLACAGAFPTTPSVASRLPPLLRRGIYGPGSAPAGV